MTDVSPVAHSDGCDPVWVCDEVSPGVACGVDDRLVVFERGAAAVDVADLEHRDFGNPETRGVGRGQRDARLQTRNGFQKPHDFVAPKTVGILIWILLKMAEADAGVLTREWLALMGASTGFLSS